jgi:hypothetical protein
VRFGSLTIPPFLKPGNWLELDGKAVSHLYRSANLKPSKQIPLTVAEKLARERHEQKLRRHGRSQRK